MRLTIIPADNVVIIDGEAKPMQLDAYPALKGIHAVQWSGDKGHVERDDQPNETLDNLRVFQDIVTAWRAKPSELRATPIPFDPTQQPGWGQQQPRGEPVPPPDGLPREPLPKKRTLP